MKRFPKIFIILVMNFIAQFIGHCVINSSVHADEKSYEFSKLRLSGFGTISNTFDDRDDMAPMRDITKNGVHINDYDKNITWRMDSRIGLHADYQFNSNLECVIQGVLRDHADPDFISSIELAYLGFKPLPLLNVRIGRIGYDAFLMSDIRNTGYAYLWVRPPIEFYGFIPMPLNGVDAALDIENDDVKWRIKAQGGETSVNIDMDTDTNNFETGDLLTLTLTRQSGPLKIKAGYFECTSLNEVKGLQPLHGGLEAVAAIADSISFPDIKTEALSLRNEMSFKDNDIKYMTLGALYDDGKLIAQAEIARTTSSKDFLPTGDMGYLSIGYRINDFTPYAMLSIISPGADLHKPVANWNAISSYFGEDAEAFHSMVIAISNSTRAEQYTTSLGLRWDFNNQSALKVQWDNVNIETYGYGLWLWSGETYRRDSTANLYTLSMEFVF